MNEQEWLHSNDPNHLLACIETWLSDRKLRLFVENCCDRVWPELACFTTQEHVDILRRISKGNAKAEDLEIAKQLSQQYMVNQVEDLRAAIVGSTAEAVLWSDRSLHSYLDVRHSVHAPCSRLQHGRKRS